MAIENWVDRMAERVYDALAGVKPEGAAWNVLEKEA